MKIHRPVVIFAALLFASISFANQDPWKGDDYAKNSESQKESAEDFLQGIPLENITSVLDVGCGDGKVTAAMAQRIPQSSFLGIDISPSMIQTAKNAFSGADRLSFQVQDATSVNFEEKFDLITSFTVMHWVLNQNQALKGFEKALKPGGKLCIQMPTSLPSAMQQALDETLSQDKWKGYFTDFSAPWHFYNSNEYGELLINAGLIPSRIGVTLKHERFPSRVVFHGFLRQWFPYLRPLPENLKDLFLKELLDRYLELLPVDEQGKVSFIVNRLEVIALKKSS